MKDSVFKKLRGTDRLPNSRRGMRKNASEGSLRNSTAVSMSVSFKNSKHSKCAFFKISRPIGSEKLNKPESFKRKNLLGRLDSKPRAVICNRDSNQLWMLIEDCKSRCRLKKSLKDRSHQDTQMTTQS